MFALTEFENQMKFFLFCFGFHSQSPSLSPRQSLICIKSMKKFLFLELSLEEKLDFEKNIWIFFCKIKFQKNLFLRLFVWKQDVLGRELSFETNCLLFEFLYKIVFLSFYKETFIKGILKLFCNVFFSVMLTMGKIWWQDVSLQKDLSIK